MTNITDNELTTLQNTFNMLDSVISPAQSSNTANIKQMVTEALNIINSKIEQSKKAANVIPVGSSFSLSRDIISNIIAKKNKQMFEMFHLT